MKEELTMKEEFSLVYQHKHKQPIEKNKRLSHPKKSQKKNNRKHRVEIS